MDIKITGRNIEITDALKSFTEDKMDKVLKFHENVLSANVVLHAEHDAKIAEGTIVLKGFEAQAKAEADDMYAAIEMLVDKLTTQIGKHKDKLLDKQHHRT